MIKSIILVGFWLFLIPILLGIGILRFDKKKNKNICLALILGLFSELLMFSILAIPMTFLKCTFSVLKDSWAVVMIILSIVSIFLNRNDLKEIVNVNFEEIKKLPKILTIVFLVLLIIQCYYPFKYMYEDYDDSNFVAKATIAMDTDTLFVYDDTGRVYTELPTRTVLSQFPHYTAIIASLSNIHPAALAHTVFPVVFIIIAYGFYYVFGKALFKQDQNKTMVFLVLLAIIYIFGDYSRYTNFVRLLCRTWQGKSLIANLTIPFIWYIFIEYIGKENNKFGWGILLLCLGGSITFSSMAFILPPMMFVILMLLYAIKDKKKSYIIGLVSMILIGIIIVSVYITIDNPIVENATIKNKELTFADKVNVFIEEVKSEENINLVKDSFARAGGGKHYFVLFCIAILYIFVNNKDNKKDILYTFAIYSCVVILINFNPVFSKAWSWILGSDVYWRVYWLLPIGYSVAYMFADIVCSEEKKYKRIFIMILSICILVISGKLVLNKNNFKDVDNYYKVPDLLLEIIFTIQADDEEYKKVAGLEEINAYARQIDGNILLYEGRRVIDNYSEGSIVGAAMQKDILKLYNIATWNRCNYIIIKRDMILNLDLTNYGFYKKIENDLYVLYKNENYTN